MDTFIPAKRMEGFVRLFSLYNQWLIRFHFEGVYLKQEGHVDIRQPALFVCNHSSWWDGLMALALNQHAFRHEAYVPMHVHQLLRYRFFRYMGAFGLDRERLSSVRQGMLYMQRLIESGKSLWMFPQGDEFDLHHRPLRFFSGCGELLVRYPQLTVVPVTFYHGFRRRRKPAWFICVGTSPSLSRENRKGCTRQLKQILTRQLDQLRQDVIQGNGQLKNIL
jgi:1-acyl-sn-glycerol-3-phosphate acyltransferase